MDAEGLSRSSRSRGGQSLRGAQKDRGAAEGLFSLSH